MYGDNPNPISNLIYVYIINIYTLFTPLLNIYVDILLIFLFKYIIYLTKSYIFFFIYDGNILTILKEYLIKRA